MTCIEVGRDFAAGETGRESGKGTVLGESGGSDKESWGGGVLGGASASVDALATLEMGNDCSSSTGVLNSSPASEGPSSLCGSDDWLVDGVM